MIIPVQVTMSSRRWIHGSVT